MQFLKEKWQIVVIVILAALCLAPLISPPFALLLGIVIAQFISHPAPKTNQKVVGILLKVCVVGLGFGINSAAALQAGQSGLLLTVGSIAITLLLGLLLGRLLGIDSKISNLISAGTAICGGSAIAAVSTLVNANAKQISVAIGIVFILNSVALFVFPPLGLWLDLSQIQFGTWCAIAIHDTSSVVGAASVFGDEALQVATTIKLMRALWILPLSLVYILVSQGGTAKPQIPYFIGLFLVAIVFNSYVPAIGAISNYIVIGAKAGLSTTLFLVGTTLSYSDLKNVGIKPLLQGIILWLAISAGSLVVILLSN